VSLYRPIESAVSTDECPLRVKLRKTQCEQMFSALPLKPDIAEYGRHVRFVPSADITMDGHPI